MQTATPPTVPPHERVDILGVRVSAINMELALETIAAWIARREPQYVTVTPLHAIIDCNEQPELLPIFNGSGMTTPDGMSIVWLLRRRGFKDVDRVYGPDLMQAVLDRSQATGWKHFFYGGAEGVAEELAAKLTAKYPRAIVAGTYTPPFRPLTPEEDAVVRERIRTSGADIVWVGISSPKQERWMVEHRGEVGAPVLIGVGAAYDFLSGRKKQAPRWIQRSGMEWLFRLATEPRRLWSRYARYPRYVRRLLRAPKGAAINSSVNARTVAIIQKYVPEYRVPFFNTLRTALAEKGITLDLFHGDPHGSDVTKRDAKRVTWAKHLPQRTIKLGRRTLFIQRPMASLFRYDLVIVEQANKLLLNYVLLASQHLNGPRIAFWGHGREFSVSRRALGSRFKRFVTQRAAWFFAYTNMSVAALIEDGIESRRITVVQNAIDTTDLAAASLVSPEALTERRSRLGLASARVAVYVGSLYAAKRLDFLLAAAEHVRAQIENFHLLIVGEGPDRSIVEAFARTREWIHVCGRKTGAELADLYSVSELLLVPHAVGLVILDSFATATPLVTVSSDSHGPEIEYVQASGAGVIVSSDDALAYASRVVELLNDDRALDALRRNCASASTRYTLATMVGNFANGVELALESVSR